MEVKEMSQVMKKNCSKCQNEKRIIDFYKSYSPLDTDERLRICKSCIQNMINLDNVNSWKDVLRMIDKPFIYHLYESANSRNAPVGEYFKLINAKDFRHMNWADSDYEYNEDITNEIENDQPTVTHKSNFKLNDEIVHKWGYGYTQEEYKAFEQKYSMLRNNYQEKNCDAH